MTQPQLLDIPDLAECLPHFVLRHSVADATYVQSIAARLFIALRCSLVSAATASV